jgi:HK97 family phage portal protein
MGLFDLFVPTVKAASPEASISIDAAESLYPVNTLNSLGGYYFMGNQTATRTEAMGVPALARARNIICTTIGSFGMHTRNIATGERVQQPRVINQPDPRIAGSAFWSWLAEDILFYGYGYARVMQRYADTGRIQAMERIDPLRVTVQTNGNGTEIDAYAVDGLYIDPSELVVFTGLDEGILNRAGRTIRAASALEKTAYDFAIDPNPQTILKNSGVALPKDRVAALVAAFKNRTSKAVTFLNGDVSIETVGYDPKNLQLNEARGYLALELCRAAGLPAFFASAEPNSFTYSNAVSERRSLIDYSLRPLMTAIEQRMSLSDFTPLGQDVKFDLDDFLRGNPMERAQVYEILHRIGAMSIDEIREEEDLLL